MDDVVTIVLGFTLTTVAGGWWASRLQQRSWAKQNDLRLREAESERATAVCRDVTMLLDRRLYRMQRLYWAATGYADGSGDEEQLERRREEYVEVLVSWNEHLNVNLALVGSYFGDGARADLDRLYEEFKRVGQGVEAMVRASRAGEDTRGLAAAVSVEFEGRGVGTLNDRVYELGLRLMGQLRDGLVGRYAPNTSTPRAIPDGGSGAGP